MLNCCKLLLIVLAITRCSNCFLVGDCIGPKNALERFLDKSERSVLRNIVHEHFNGKNSQEVMRLVLTFVRSRLSQQEWGEIQPEIRAHEARQPECSIYAQLLPTGLYRQLLQRVWEASEQGADEAQIRQMVGRFVADLTSEGQLVTVAPHEEEETPDNPVPRARRTFPTLLQYPEDGRPPWYPGPPVAEETTVDRRVVARKIVDGGRSFVPLPAAQPVRWLHASGRQHVSQRRPTTITVFPTLIPALNTAIERTQDSSPEENNDHTEGPPVFERFTFSNEAVREVEQPPPVRQLPIPVAKMPRIRLSDGRYMRPPLTLKVARALATRMPRTSGTTARRRVAAPPPLPPPSSSPSPPAAPSRHSRRRRPLAPGNQLTFPRVLPRFELDTASAPVPLRRHPLIDLH